MTLSTRPPLAECRVSVVLPLLNEAEVLPRLHKLVAATLEQIGCDYEILFVNDGSTDDSAAILDDLAAADARVKVLHFSRNFGHQAAVHAGLCHARGNCVIVMDSDLQDDPASIAAFLAKWQEGFDVVYAVRVARKENAFKRMLFYSFYRLLNSVSRTRMPPDAGNFGLVDGRVAREIAQLVEHDRYFPGLRSWVGYRQTGIPVERGERHDDRPRVSLFGLFRLAKSAIFSFSTLPLSMFYFIAALSMLVCAALVAFTLYHKIFTGQAIPGWTSITITASLFGALNALGIGILGEYVVRVYDQVRARPLYVVARKVNVAEEASCRAQESRTE
jgi:dolichol-phosphate mannosyltransferase